MKSLSRIFLPAFSGILIAGSAFLFLDAWQGAGLTNLARPLLAAIFFAFASYRLGSFLMKGEIEEHFALGALALSLWPMILGSIGRLSTGALVLPLVIAIFLPARRRAGEEAREFIGRVRRTLDDSGSFGIILFATGAIVLAWALLSALAPPKGMDAMVYHLNLPAQYLARGHIHPVYGIVFYGYTQAQEMMTIFLLAMDSSGIGTGIFLALFLPLAAIAAARSAGDLAEAERTGAIARVIAFAAVVSMPLASLIIAHTKPDILAMALFTMGLARLSPRRLSPLHAGLFLGGAVAVKVTAAFGAIPALLYLGWTKRKDIPALGLTALGTAAFPVFWFARNLFLDGQLLPHAGFIAGAAAGETGPDLAMRLARPFAATFLFMSKELDGPLGPLFAALVLGSLFAIREKSHERNVSLIGFAAFAFWFATGGGANRLAQGGVFRFLLPALPAFIIAGSSMLARSLAEDSRRLTHGLVLIAVLVNLAVSVRILEKYHRHIPYLAGQITIEEYMKGWLAPYRILTEASNPRVLPPDAKVLSVGEPRLFYLRRDACFDPDGTLPRVFNQLHDYHDEKNFADWMRLAGFTHILDAYGPYGSNILTGLSPALPCDKDRPLFEKYLREHCTLILADDENQLFLYRTVPGPHIPTKNVPGDTTQRLSYVSYSRCLM